MGVSLGLVDTTYRNVTNDKTKEKTMENIILIGTRCVGKTTVGDLLAKKMQELTGERWRFVDTDRAIMDRCKKTVRDVFEQFGEQSFRNLETEIIHGFQEDSNLIISVGGGALLRNGNKRKVKEIGTVVLLKASSYTTVKRLADDPKSVTTRPSVNRTEKEMGIIENNHHDAANIIVGTDGITPDGVVKIICGHHAVDTSYRGVTNNNSTKEGVKMFCKEITFSVPEAENLMDYLSENCESSGRNEYYSDSVTFDDGHRVTLTIVDGVYRKPHIECVLFDPDGFLIECVYPEHLLGEYVLSNGKRQYEVDVYTDMRDHYDSGVCPDCNVPIDEKCVNGMSCHNCDHVFNIPDCRDMRVCVDISSLSSDYTREDVEMEIARILNEDLTESQGICEKVECVPERLGGPKA